MADEKSDDNTKKRSRTNSDDDDGEDGAADMIWLIKTKDNYSDIHPPAWEECKEQDAIANGYQAWVDAGSKRKHRKLRLNNDKETIDFKDMHMTTYGGATRKAIVYKLRRVKRTERDEEVTVYERRVAAEKARETAREQALLENMNLESMRDGLYAASIHDLADECGEKYSAWESGQGKRVIDDITTIIKASRLKSMHHGDIVLFDDYRGCGAYVLDVDLAGRVIRGIPTEDEFGYTIPRQFLDDPELGAEYYRNVADDGFGF